MKNQTWMNLTESLTLKDVNITGEVLGRFGIYKIFQSYENYSGKTLEVFYTFPLSRTASVYDFTAKIGDKVIRGIVKEKSQAKKDYQRAITRGDSAYLVEREYGNIFKVTLGKIAAGEQVEVILSYIDVHDITDNTVEVRIPTVVAPRYNDQITAKQTYQQELDYTADIVIYIDNALKIADVNSPSHSIKVKNNTVSTSKVKLNKDYILYIKLEDEMRSGGYVYKTEDGAFAFLQFMPELSKFEDRAPQKFVFIVDCSGSMRGMKMDKTKAALKKCLMQLKRGDEFTIIRFGTHFDNIDGFAQVSEQNLKNAMGWIDTFSSSYGGTEIWSPIEYALNKFDGEKTLVLLTDGQIGRAENIAEYIRRIIGDNRLFIFGIDSAVNDAGLVSFARAGRGKAEFFTPDEHLDLKIVRQFSRINGTSCAAVSLDCGKNDVNDILESEDTVFNHEYWCAVVKASDFTDEIALLCKTDDKTLRFVLNPSDLQTTETVLDKVYAKEKIDRIKEYIDRNIYHNNVAGYVEQIVEIAVKYNINSEYTSFLAINEREHKIFGVPEQEQITLEKPEGWEMPDLRIAESTDVFNGISAAPISAYSDSFFPSATINPVFEKRTTFVWTEFICEGSKTTLCFDDGTVKVVVIGKDIEMDSPLVRAILGKREGEDVYYVENDTICHVIIQKVENPDNRK